MDLSEMSIEDTFKELEKTIEKLSAEDISLEEAFSEYKKGMDLVKASNDKIEKVEKELIILEENS